MGWRVVAGTLAFAAGGSCWDPPIDHTQLEKHKDGDCTFFESPASWWNTELRDKRGINYGSKEVLMKQANALMELYKSSEGATRWPKPFLENWGDLSKVCDWKTQGMTGMWKGTNCAYGMPYTPGPPASNGQNVREVTINHGMGKGPLHEDWKWMISLATLNLRGNAFDGPFPDTGVWLGTMFVDVSHNQFSGALPDDFLGGPCLQSLNLGHNRFEGTIPKSLRSRTVLMSLRINSNQFSGTIPDFGSMPELAEIDLSLNRLSGTVPSTLFTGAPKLRWLRLHQNELLGPLPPGIASGTPLLSVLSVAGNKGMEGTEVPSDVASLGLLRVFNGSAGMKCPAPDMLSYVPESTACGGGEVGSTKMKLV
eukprot:TRINITY_DN47614_c0_g1_i1.p1 TRINITY_DN47614_c0_g1~~TRINITY_DN47614_c0_g1_i1.p1  ORF type:complete len:367 (+),score=104.53 TRINITY_DN47614_c0_g1_i1:51-1151(+)